MSVYIYGLCEPDSGELRYIGCAQDPEKRLAQHIASRRKRYPLYDWLHQLLQRKARPSITILAEVVLYDGSQAEIWWTGCDVERTIIRQHASPRLLNISHNKASLVKRRRPPKGRARRCAICRGLGHDRNAHRRAA